ncbi:MAG: c-type cytochrome [Planctomycetes bacterium]|nr:c-type cytochrome [Planctomycetota bacterium]
MGSSRVLAAALMGVAVCVGLLAGTSQTTAGDQPATKKKVLEIDKDAAARGKVQYTQLCAVCHSVDGTRRVALPLNNAWGTEVEQTDGTTVLFDRAFLRESLVAPRARITKGFTDSMTPFKMEEADLTDLAEYLRSIADPEKVMAADEKETGQPIARPAPRINIRFLYGFCNDIPATRRFYTELLGMKEGAAVDSKDFGFVTYRCEGLEYMFFRTEKPMPVEERWADQPGEALDGAQPLMSMSIAVPWSDFKATVKRLRDAKVKAAKPSPSWRQASYWGWTIKDPMGNTIEVYSTPDTKPEGEPVWRD